MIKKTFKHSALLIFASCVTIFVIGLYAYMYHAIDASVARIVAARISSASAKSSGNNAIQNYVSNYKADAEKWTRLPKFFIDPDQEVAFIEIIEGFSAKSGSKVVIDSIDADNLDAVPQGTEGFIRARISSTGSWSSVMRALQLTESVPYKISIGNVKLDQFTGSMERTNPKDKTPKSEWKLSFDLKVSMMELESATTTTK